MATQAQIVYISVSNHGPTDDLVHMDLWNNVTMHPQHTWHNDKQWVSGEDANLT